MTRVEAFATHAEMAEAAAEILAVSLAAPGARTFVATGGSTAGPVYDCLAKYDLPWDRLTVTLTDERWVKSDSDLSNEGLIRRRLLVGKAASAAFFPLRRQGDSLAADARSAETGLRGLLPSAAVLLGMGVDGHVASLFPGGPEPADPRLCLAVTEAGLAPYVPRLSLTARAFLQSRLVIVLIAGDDKRAVIQRLADDPDFAPPAAAILRQSSTPVRVLWTA